MLDIIPIHTDILFENICRKCDAVHESSNSYIQMVADGEPFFLLSDNTFTCSYCGTHGVGVRLFETIEAAVAYGNELMARWSNGEVVRLRAATAQGRPAVIRLESDQKWLVE